MNAQNQQYYEFQWRVLNLCAEFYGAAEELVVSYLSFLYYRHFVNNLIERDGSPRRRSVLSYGSRNQSRPLEHARRSQTSLRHSGMLLCLRANRELRRADSF